MGNLAENSKFSKTLLMTTENLRVSPNDSTKNQSANQNDLFKQTNNGNFRTRGEDRENSGNSILTNLTTKNLGLLPNDSTKNQSAKQDDLLKHTNFSVFRNCQDNRINWVIPKIFGNLGLYSKITKTSRPTFNLPPFTASTLSKNLSLNTPPPRVYPTHHTRSTYWESLSLACSFHIPSLLDHTHCTEAVGPSIIFALLRLHRLLSPPGEITDNNYDAKLLTHPTPRSISWGKTQTPDLNNQKLSLQTEAVGPSIIALLRHPWLFSPSGETTDNNRNSHSKTQTMSSNKRNSLPQIDSNFLRLIKRTGLADPFLHPHFLSNTPLTIHAHTAKIVGENLAITNSVSQAGSLEASFWNLFEEVLSSYIISGLPRLSPKTSGPLVGPIWENCCIYSFPRLELTTQARPTLSLKLVARTFIIFFFNDNLVKIHD